MDSLSMVYSLVLVEISLPSGFLPQVPPSASQVTVYFLRFQSARSVRSPKVPAGTVTVMTPFSFLESTGLLSSLLTQPFSS